MLRICDPSKHLPNSSYLPNSYLVEPTGYFEPGMIGTLKKLGGQIVCGVSNGTAPIGIIDDIRVAPTHPTSPGANSTIASGRVTIWNVPIEAETDSFKITDKYFTGGSLGVSDIGLLCSNSMDIARSGIVGRILRAPSPIAPLLYFEWIVQKTDTIWSPGRDWDGWIIKE